MLNGARQFIQLGIPLLSHYPNTKKGQRSVSQRASLQALGDGALLYSSKPHGSFAMQSSSPRCFLQSICFLCGLEPPQPSQSFIASRCCG